jgi:putative acetyltransferase
MATDGPPGVVSLRRSRTSDRESLFRIWQGAVLATHDFVSKSDLDTFGRVVRDDYLPNAELDVAVNRADQPLGFMGMTGRYIDALFVAAACHGMGVGRLLVEHAQRRFEDGLTVDVNEQNAQAFGFYERMGFRVCSRSPVDDTGRPYPLLHLAWP